MRLEEGTEYGILLSTDEWVRGVIEKVCILDRSIHVRLTTPAMFVNQLEILNPHHIVKAVPR